MSLMRLLSVSRSFCLRVPDMGRYQVTGGLRLPRFGKRQAGAGAGAGEVLRARQVELPMAGEATKGVGCGEMCGGIGKGAGRGKDRWGWWRRWVSGVAGAWRRLLEPSRCGGGRRRQPVQTAFLLESVKVVRNDLADADLELMRIRKRRREVTGMVRQVTGTGSGGGGRSGLGRMAVRWLTSGRVG